MGVKISGRAIVKGQYTQDVMYIRTLSLHQSKCVWLTLKQRILIHVDAFIPIRCVAQALKWTACRPGRIYREHTFQRPTVFEANGQTVVTPVQRENLGRAGADMTSPPACHGPLCAVVNHSPFGARPVCVGRVKSAPSPLVVRDYF